VPDQSFNGKWIFLQFFGDTVVSALVSNDHA
jgi:hypothetical protein